MRPAFILLLLFAAAAIPAELVVGSPEASGCAPMGIG